MNFEVIFHSLFPTLGIEATWTSKKSFPYNLYGDALPGGQGSSGVRGRPCARCYRSMLTTPRGVPPPDTPKGHHREWYRHLRPLTP